MMVGQAASRRGPISQTSNRKHSACSIGPLFESFASVIPLGQAQDFAMMVGQAASSARADKSN